MRQIKNFFYWIGFLSFLAAGCGGNFGESSLVSVGNHSPTHNTGSQPYEPGGNDPSSANEPPSGTTTSTGLDVCDNYNTTNINKPVGYPNVTSLFQQAWTHRRVLNPVTDVDVGAGLDEASLVTAFNKAQGGETLVVHDLPANELDGFSLTNKKFSPGNEVHIYFVNPIDITHALSNSGDTVYINNVEGLVFDGMNNLRIRVSAGAKPRAQLFLGGMGSSSGYNSTVRTVFKNFQVDGGYVGTAASGPKWAVFGEDNTDLGFCNLKVSNVWLEHGFYFHHLAGNFEVVNSQIDNVGRTCVQVRADHFTPATTNYIIADNVCSNSCNGGAFTLDDPSGTWWVKGNKASRMVQGIVSIDSTQGSYFNHTDGEVYIYDNALWMGNDPTRTQWGFSCENLASHVNIKDGGASFYMQDNVFLSTGGSLNFVLKQYVSPTWPNHFESVIAESDYNTFGFGHPSHSQTFNANERVSRWDWPSAGQPTFLSITQWQQVMPSINKPTAYGQNSNYVFGSTNIQNLINTHFAGLP